MTIRPRPKRHSLRRLGARSARALRLSGAFVLGICLAFASTTVGLAADPTTPSSDTAAHDDAVARIVEDAIAGASTGSGDPQAVSPAASAAVDPTPRLVASPSPTPSRTPTPTPVPTPSPTPSRTPTPTPNITPPPRPATVDARVPSTVLSSLRSVSGDLARPYYDGCHVATGGSMPSKSCLYGHLSSHTTIALYGDSHALAWFPALLRVVNDRGWRLLNVTMSACIPADITPYSPATGVMRACINFRKAAIAKLTRYHPAMIIVTGTRGFQTIDSSGHVLTGTARTTAWVNGMKRTVAKLVPITSRVVMLADTPNTRFSNPTGCIATHPLHELSCTTPVLRALSYSWLNTEFHVALAKHVGFIDPERWVCPSSPCPLVRGTYVVYRNGGHMTARYSATMWRKFESAVLTVRAKSGAIVGP